MATQGRCDGSFLYGLRLRLKWLAVLVLLAPVLATVSVRAVTLPESIPDFSLDTSRPGVQSVQSGSWASASTWQGGQVPTANHVVRIVQGHTVTISDTAAVAYTIAVDGKLTFATGVNTRLKVTNLEVMAGEQMARPASGSGHCANPIAAGVIAEIIIANSPLGGSVGRGSVRHGIIVLGKVSIRQREDADLRGWRPSRAGNATLTLSEASGLRPATGWSCPTPGTSKRAK